MRLLALGWLISIAAVASAAETTGALPSVSLDRYDFSSLQRGAAAFMNNCVGCHSAQYVRYNRLVSDLGIPEELVKEKLMHDANAAIGDGIVSAMRPEDAEAWFNRALPPDLSLSAKLRGADWLYAYLRGFYRDDSTGSGWNNTVFPNVAMPHALAYLQGEHRRTEDGEYEQVKAGLLTPVEYDLYILDMVNFMAYMADPDRPTRYRYGYIFLIVLLILSIPAYLLYQEYWRDID